MAEKKKKKAMKRLLVGKDGQRRTMYIDLDTYQYIPDALLPTFDILNDDTQTIEYVETVARPNELLGIILDHSDPTSQAISQAISTRNPLGPQAASRPTQSVTPAQPVEPVQDEVAPAPAAADVYDENGIPTVDPDSPFAPAPATQGPTSQLPSLDYNRFAPPSAETKFAQKDEPVSSTRSVPVGIATADTAKTDAAKSGTSMGFAALAPRGLETNLKENYGDLTVGPASEDITNAARAAVADVFGPGYTVNATSGERHGGSGNHSKGRGALDFGVLDPKGNPVTDKESMVALGAAMGRQGFQSLGHGKGYMFDGGFHGGAKISTGGVHGWGAGNKFATRDKEVYNAFMGEKVPGAIGILPGTTTGVPTDNPSKSGFAPTAERTKDDIQMGSVSMANSEIAPQETQTAKAMESTKDTPTTRGGFVPGRDTFDMATATPAQFAAYGYTSRSKEEKDYIYTTLAGELGPKSLQGLMKGDPAAKQELANMLATIENRAASKNYAGKSLEKSVLAGSQFNAREPEKMGTTTNNYSIYGDTISKLGDDFYAGKLAPSAWDIDMFHASDMAKPPSWSASLIGAADVGQHRFGENPKNYAPTADFYNERSKWEGVQTSETRGFDPGKGEGFANYSGPNTASGSRSDTPSEGGSRFGGGGLGTPDVQAKDSPSEGGSKFGGTGLGTPNTPTAPTAPSGYDKYGTPENENSRGGPR